MAMFDWIEMHIIDMVGEIVLVAQRVLPKATLPDFAFALSPMARRNEFVCG